MTLRDQTGAAHFGLGLFIVLLIGLVWFFMLAAAYRRDQQYAEIGARLSHMEQSLNRLELELTRREVHTLNPSAGKSAP